MMALNIRDYTINKAVQATYHQDDVRCGTSHVCLLCQLLGLRSVRSPGTWDKFDLDCILGQGDQLFKFIKKFRYLGMEDLPQKFFLENSSINVEFLENKTKKITAGAYLHLFQKL